MSSEAPDQDSKTEDPSQKKLEDAHKKGDVAKSQEVTTWFMLMGSGIVFALLSPWISTQLSQPLSLIFMNADQFDLDGAGFADFFNGLALAMIGVVLIPLAVLELYSAARRSRSAPAKAAAGLLVTLATVFTGIGILGASMFLWF